MATIEYLVGDKKVLDEVKELWEGLNAHHRVNSKHYADFYSSFTFEARKADLLKKTQNGNLRVEIAIDKEIGQNVGYCISSIDEGKIGEIESIYILNDYRGMGIGDRLMKNALDWMDEMGAIKRVVTVATGNEQAFGFYEKFGFYPRRTVLEQAE